MSKFFQLLIINGCKYGTKSNSNDLPFEPSKTSPGLNNNFFDSTLIKGSWVCKTKLVVYYIDPRIIGELFPKMRLFPARNLNNKFGHGPMLNQNKLKFLNIEF